ncbi:hypothetical protein D3C71_1778250 [compost metagenome]
MQSLRYQSHPLPTTDECHLRGYGSRLVQHPRSKPRPMTAGHQGIEVGRIEGSREQYEGLLSQGGKGHRHLRCQRVAGRQCHRQPILLEGVYPDIPLIPSGQPHQGQIQLTAF